MDPEIDYGHRYQIVATRDVQAGEQLQNSYNKCKWCDGLYANANDPYEYYVTPQLFEVYGFPELWPQRWILPKARLLFDVRESNGDDDTEELQVDFVAPPSPDGIDFLKARLRTLNKFERKYGNNTDIPRNEHEGIFSLHGAMTRAFSLALEQSVGQISDRVWYMGNNWHRDEHHNSYGGDEL